MVAPAQDGTPIMGGPPLEKNQVEFSKFLFFVTTDNQFMAILPPNTTKHVVFYAVLVANLRAFLALCAFGALGAPKTTFKNCVAPSTR